MLFNFILICQSWSHGEVIVAWHRKFIAPLLQLTWKPRQPVAAQLAVELQLEEVIFEVIHLSLSPFSAPINPQSCLTPYGNIVDDTRHYLHQLSHAQLTHVSCLAWLYTLRNSLYSFLLNELVCILHRKSRG